MEDLMYQAQLVIVFYIQLFLSEKKKSTVTWQFMMVIACYEE